MPADNPLAVERDGYRKTAADLSDLIRDLEVYVDKFKSLGQIVEDDKTDVAQLRGEGQKVYRELATLIELAARLAHPQ
jgi:hypothetical protein